MKKIAILGSAGSGKSTLAPHLGRILGIPVYHLDALHWKPGWVETPREEWRAIQEDLVAGDSWIIDGNYGSTASLRIDAADTIIFMDLPRIVCVWRVVARRLRHLGRTRPDMGPGCPEGFDRDFLKFLRWVWTYPEKERPAMLALIKGARRKRVIILRSSAQAERFLEKARHEASLPPSPLSDGPLD